MKPLNKWDEKYITVMEVFDMDLINVNFQLDKSIHKRAKEYALRNDMTIKELYTKWIIDGLVRETGQTTLDDGK